MKQYIYLLPEYANQTNLEYNRYGTEDEHKITYSKEGIQISLIETNSLIEDEYCLNLKSATYIIEGTTETKESMIHHHQTGHQSRHLQFKLKSRNETIRIMLEFIDLEDYKSCIKGFLHISRELIDTERRNNRIGENLQEYFFNDDIEKLTNDRKFLLDKIRQAFSTRQIMDASDGAVNKKKLLELKKETHLSPFFDW